MDFEEQDGDFAAAAAAAGIQSGDAPAALMSVPYAAASGTAAPIVRAASRVSWGRVLDAAPALPTTWQDALEPGPCELVLYALLWLYSVALQSSTVVEAAREKRRNKQNVQLDDFRAMDINLQWLVTFKKVKDGAKAHADERLSVGLELDDFDCICVSGILVIRFHF